MRFRVMFHSSPYHSYAGELKTTYEWRPIFRKSNFQTTNFGIVVFYKTIVSIRNQILNKKKV